MARSGCTSAAAPRPVRAASPRGSTIAGQMPSTAVADALMETFVIEGSQPLNGRITASGNKNGALPILAGCLLTDEPVTLTNVPRIRDVETMVELLARLGADAEWIAANEVRVHAADLTPTDVDDELARRIRPPFLLPRPPLARPRRAPA